MLLAPAFLPASDAFNKLRKPLVIKQGPIWIYLGKLEYIEHQNPFWIYRIESPDGMVVYAPKSLASAVNTDDQQDLIPNMLSLLYTDMLMPLEILVILRIHFSMPITIVNNMVADSRVKFKFGNQMIDDLTILRICEYVIERKKRSDEETRANEVENMLRNPTNLALFELDPVVEENTLMRMDKLVRKRTVNYSKLVTQHYLEKAILFRSFAIGSTFEDMKQQAREVIYDFCQNGELIAAYISEFNLENLHDFEMRLIERTLEFMVFMSDKVSGKKPVKRAPNVDTIVKQPTEMTVMYERLSKKGIKKQAQDRRIMDLLNDIYTEFATIEYYIGSNEPVYTGTFGDCKSKVNKVGATIVIPNLLKAHTALLDLLQLKHNDCIGLDMVHAQFLDYFECIFGKIELHETSKMIQIKEIDQMKRIRALMRSTRSDKVTLFMELQESQEILNMERSRLKSQRSEIIHKIQDITQTIPDSLDTADEIEVYKEFVHSSYLYFEDAITKFKEIHRLIQEYKMMQRKLAQYFIPGYLKDIYGDIDSASIYMLESSRLGKFITNTNGLSVLEETNEFVYHQKLFLLYHTAGFYQDKIVHYLPTKLGELESVWNGLKRDLKRQYDAIGYAQVDEFVSDYLDSVISPFKNQQIEWINEIAYDVSNSQGNIDDYVQNMIINKVFEEFEMIYILDRLSEQAEDAKTVDRIGKYFDDLCYQTRTLISWIKRPLIGTILYYMSRYPLVFSFDQLSYDLGREINRLSDVSLKGVYIYKDVDVLGQYTSDRLEKINSVEYVKTKDLMSSVYLNNFKMVEAPELNLESIFAKLKL